MEFIHLSPVKIKKFKTPKKLGRNSKPSGCLWFACGKDWEKWVTEEMDDWLEDYKYQYNAELDLDNLIVLKTVEDILEFTDKFALPKDPRAKIQQYNKVDWDRVREETGKYGIYIVNPSIASIRFKIGWYYSFDVCSVGVWDKRAILSMEESIYPPS